MTTKTKSAPLPSLADETATLSPAQRKSLLAQIHLLAAMKELSALRRTVRLRTVGLDEWRQKSRKAGSPVALEWLETMERLDGDFARRLGKLRTTVSQANQLLTSDKPAGARHGKP